MKRLSQSPSDPEFVQDPNGFYARARAAGPVVFWDEFDMPCATHYGAVNALLRDRRFGREAPPEVALDPPPHLAPFYAVEQHSMLELEPPRHTRLRGLVLRAFTSRRIRELGPEIAALSHSLIDDLPREFNLLERFAQPLPVIIIARLLGVPEEMAPQMLRWSNDMVALYQARRSRAIEEGAARAASEFATFMRSYVETRRKDLRDDLISHLIAAEEEGEKLTTDELITTCILLMNAGHEATVHTIGNGVKTLLETGTPTRWFGPEGATEACVEELLRYDPPLHMFTRYIYEDTEFYGARLKRGDQIGALLACANRDEDAFDEADQFDPTRMAKANTSFGAGLHFCIGAPLARLELVAALPILFDRLPDLRLAAPPNYGNTYHFHGLERLMLAR